MKETTNLCVETRSLVGKSKMALIAAVFLLFALDVSSKETSLNVTEKSPNHYSIDKDGIVRGGGKRYIPLKSTSGFALLGLDGVNSATIASLKDKTTVKRFLKYGVPDNMIRCRIVDTIDAVKGDHDFTEDKGYGGKSKILTIGGKKYRVTDNRRKLSYFSFLFNVRHPEKAHMVIAELPNDRERYTGLRIHNPKGFSFHFGEGGGVYSGREFACDLKPHYYSFFLFPLAKKLNITVSRIPLEEKIVSESGGAVSKIWIIEMLDNPAKNPVGLRAVPEKNKRRMGLFYFHTKAVKRYLKYIKLHKIGKNWDDSFDFLATFMRFSGLNAIEFFTMNGGPMCTQIAFCDSTVFPVSNGMNMLVDSLCRRMNLNGIQTIPVIPSFVPPYEKKLPPGWDARESFQISAKGKKIALFNHWSLTDPLRPEVQKMYLKIVRETAEFYKPYPNVPEIGLYFEGRSGFGFASADWSDKSGWTDASRSCYSKWDVAKFMKETGVSGCPIDKPFKSYKWLKKHAWEKWLDWRCAKYYEIIDKASRVVVGVRKDWNAMLETWLPRMPGGNIAWGNGVSVDEIMRSHGLDSKYFGKNKNIQINMGMNFGHDRFMTPTWGRYSKSRTTNYQTHKSFYYQPRLKKFYKSGLPGVGLTLNYACWEEHMGRAFPKDSQFYGSASSLGASTFNPIGRNFFEPIAFAMRHFNPNQIMMQSWERGSFGSEWKLRRLAKAFLPLPFVQPVKFAGEVYGANENVVLQWFGDKLCVVNDSQCPAHIKLTFPAGKGTLYDLTYDTPLTSTEDDVTISLDLDTFDVRTLVRLAASEISSFAPNKPLGVNPPPSSGVSKVLPPPSGKVVFSDDFDNLDVTRSKWKIAKVSSPLVKVSNGRLILPISKKIRAWQMLTSKKKFKAPFSVVVDMGWKADANQPSGGLMVWDKYYRRGRVTVGMRNEINPKAYRFGAAIYGARPTGSETDTLNGGRVRLDFHADGGVDFSVLQNDKWIRLDSFSGFNKAPLNIFLGAKPVGLCTDATLWYDNLKVFQK